MDQAIKTKYSLSPWGSGMADIWQLTGRKKGRNACVYCSMHVSTYYHNNIMCFYKCLHSYGMDMGDNSKTIGLAEDNGQQNKAHRVQNRRCLMHVLVLYRTSSSSSSFIAARAN